jgi:hypothetical protein
MAEAFNVPVCPHFLMELHLALCCAVPNGRYLEYIPQLDLVTSTGIRFEKGMAIASQEPGNGIEWTGQQSASMWFTVSFIPANKSGILLSNLMESSTQGNHRRFRVHGASRVGPDLV